MLPQRISDKHLEAPKSAAPVIVGSRVSHMFSLPFSELNQQGLELVAVGNPMQPSEIIDQRIELDIKVLLAT